MMLKFRVILAIVVIVAFYYMFRLIIKGMLQLKYSLLWMVLGIILLILALFPWLLDYTSKFIGVFSPTNALFFFGFAFTLPVIFSLSMAISKLSTKIKDLAQELALLNNRLKELEKNEQK